MSWKKLNILLPNDDVNSIFFLFRKLDKKACLMTCWQFFSNSAYLYNDDMYIEIRAQSFTSLKANHCQDIN